MIIDYSLMIVVILLLIERYFINEQHRKAEDRLLEELSRATKAVIAKNANDYVMTTSIDKVAPEVPTPPDTDLVNEDELTDDEFIENINKQVKE